MGESSSEELSRDLSNLSFTSDDNSATSSSTLEGREGLHDGKYDVEAASSSDEYGDDEMEKYLSRESTEVSIPDTYSDSSNEERTRENSSARSKEHSQYNVFENPDVNADDASQGSRSLADKSPIAPENNDLIEENELVSKDEQLSDSENKHISRKSPTTSGNQSSSEESPKASDNRSSGESPIASDNQSSPRELHIASDNQSPTRESPTPASTHQLNCEETEISEQDDVITHEISEQGDVITHENTMSTNSETYQDDFETSPESTLLTNNETYENDFNDSSDSREQSFDSNQQPDEIEKEKSVLIERDGKFELVNPSELEAEEVEMLGLPIVAEPKEKPKGSQRPKSSTNKIPEFAHVTSAYALTETQKEMKKRRISVRHMRMNEEKQRLVEEEEKQRIANKRSYRKWMLQKSSTTTQPSKNELPERESESAANEERRRIAEESYNAWLKEKEQQQKGERKLEKIRLAEEAEHYIVRDRVMCDRSFRRWLKEKKEKGDNNNKMPVIGKSCKSANKRKQNPITHEGKPRSALPQSKPKPIYKKERPYSIAKLNERMSQVRYAESFGYRHPSSINDFVT